VRIAKPLFYNEDNQYRVTLAQNADMGLMLCLAVIPGVFADSKSN
jgi:hypothetical protein